MCSAFPLLSLLTVFPHISTQGYHQRTEDTNNVFHSTSSISAMDARLRYIFKINFVKYRNFCDAYVLKNTGAENTQFYISMSTIQNIFIKLFSLYISASNNPIFPTQVKFFSPQLSRKAIFMI